MDDGTSSASTRVDSTPGSARHDRAEFGRHVLEGLSRQPRALSSVWLYDDEGSRLFQRIMALPGYYPTGAERTILLEHGAAMLRAIDAPRLVIADLGAGDASKSILLLGAAREEGIETLYAPIDVSEEALETARDGVAARLPAQAVATVRGEYTSGLRRLGAAVSAHAMERAHRLVLLLGSNVGNCDLAGAGALLAGVRAALRPGDHVLVGFDWMKDPARLRAAYDDPEGVTAAFNLNLLARINRELGGDFDLRRWQHVATFDPRRPAMESWLMSTDRQTVRVLGRRFEIDAWEAIHTEISFKYREAHVEQLARAAGLLEVGRWSDPRRDFVDVLFRVHDRPPGAS